MNTLLHNLFPYTEDLRKICENNHATKLFFFGSVCTDKFNIESDIDLLIELEQMSPLELGETILNLWNELEDLFGRKVDLLTTDQEIRNPILRKNIDNTKQLFYDRENNKISA